MKFSVWQLTLIVKHIKCTLIYKPITKPLTFSNHYITKLNDSISFTTSYTSTKNPFIFNLFVYIFTIKILS